MPDFPAPRAADARAAERTRVGDPSLLVSGVSLALGGRQILDGVTLAARPGSVTGLLGPNGAGKTTLIRCCTGILRPDIGTIRVLGDTPGGPTAAAGTGVMPQSAGAWSGIRAGELVAYLAGLYAHPLDPDALMTELGIDGFGRTTYRRLSGGQQQLVNLACALVGRPALVFLDEPTAGLDPHVRHRTWDVIDRLRDKGVAVVLTTHAMDEAARLADRLFLLDAGHIVASGTVAELTAHESLEELFLRVTRAAA